MELITISREDYNDLENIALIFNAILPVLEEDKHLPMAKMAGSTTLGNQIIEARAILERILPNNLSVTEEQELLYGQPTPDFNGEGG